MLHRLPIGIDDFRVLRERGLEYVDKTQLVCDILDRPGEQVLLLPRPRRFGKTLNLSMLRCFFEKRAEDLAPLFQGLRVFAHDVRPNDCSSQGESPEHRELKRRVAGAIRAAGGQALIEALPSPSDRGGWRADVLGVGLDERRVAVVRLAFALANPPVALSWLERDVPIISRAYQPRLA